MLPAILTFVLILGGCASTPPPIPTPPEPRGYYQTPKLELYMKCRQDGSMLPYYRYKDRDGRRVIKQRLQCKEA